MIPHKNQGWLSIGEQQLRYFFAKWVVGSTCESGSETNIEPKTEYIHAVLRMQRESEGIPQ